MSTATDTKGRTVAYVALALVCVLWGTTYLGIRISIETIPPLFLVAIRYSISGWALLFGAKAAGLKWPTPREFLLTGICGAICIGVGNGFLAVAEGWVPSGLAALFYTTAPFWMVGIDAVLPGGRRPLVSTLIGLLVGFFGIAILVLPGVRREGLHGGTFTGFLILQISAAGWVLGALLQKRVQTTVRPLVTGAVQQLAAGFAMLFPALLFNPAPHQISVRSMWAVAYLVVFGSFFGFSAFIYCMTHLPVAIVSIYTFVNPVVAVFLGWLFFREAFGVLQMISMLVIFTGIAIVKWSESRHARREAAATLADAEAIGTEP